MNPQVILFPRGQLKEADRARLEAAGIIAVEVDDPGKVVAAPTAMAFLPADDLMFAALTAICTTPSYSSPSTTFADTIYRLAKAKRETPAQGHSQEPKP